MTESTNKIIGCILGGAVGDACGVPYEGCDSPVEPVELKGRKISDDTQLTLATCEAIIETGGVVEPSVVASRFASRHRDQLYGMTDADSDVRNNSMRALAVIAGFARHSPNQRINVPFKPFIDMLNSIAWTDCNKSSLALSQLTEKRDPAVLSDLRKLALPSLVEMSRWKSPGHALPAFFLLGCIGGLSEDEILMDWNSGNREALIEKVLRKIKSRVEYKKGVFTDEWGRKHYQKANPG